MQLIFKYEISLFVSKMIQIKFKYRSFIVTKVCKFDIFDKTFTVKLKRKTYMN